MGDATGEDGVSEVERAEHIARSIVGWPDCRCGASDYRHVRTDGLIRWIEPTGALMPKRIMYCRHRELARQLLLAYRRGRRDGKA